MERFSTFWSRLRLNVDSRTPTIGFTDPYDPRILRAVSQLLFLKSVRPVLLGDRVKIFAACDAAKLPRVPDEAIYPSEFDRKRFVEILIEKQKKGNVGLEVAQGQLTDPLYLGVCALIDGQLDGLVGGSTRPTADVVRAAIQCVGTSAGHKLVSGQFLIESESFRSADDTPFLFADCAVMPDPSPLALAVTAKSAAESFHFFTGAIPRVAMLSFSTRGSAEHAFVDKVKEAVRMAKKQNPDLIIDGEIQADAALDQNVADIKHAGDSPLNGKSNVFLFPNLESGNIAYKLVQRFSNARVAGPILWGLQKPMSDLSRGCTADEVVDTALCVAKMVRGQN